MRFPMHLHRGVCVWGMPPSTLIGVTRLSDPEFLIEIDLMAVTE